MATFPLAGPGPEGLRPGGAFAFGMAVGGPRSGLVRWGGVCGILGVVVTLALVLAASAMEPTFRWDQDALSDLGVRSVAPVFNAAVILGGILTIPFGLGVRAWLPRRRLTDLGAIILVIGGVSLALVGVFTLDYPGLHALFALGYFLLVPVGMLVLAFVFEDRRWVWFTVGSAVAAIVSIIVLPVALLNAPVGFAVPEIIEAMFLSAWIALTGVRMVRSAPAVGA